MATLLKVLDNLADIKSAGGVALGLGTQVVMIDSPLNWLDANWLYERGADNRRELGRGYRRKLAASSG
jgi:hypothetical protein